jgi:hypothetical protein
MDITILQVRVALLDIVGRYYPSAVLHPGTATLLEGKRLILTASVIVDLAFGILW